VKLSNMSLGDMIEAIRNLSKEDKQYLLKCIDINIEAARKGSRQGGEGGIEKREGMRLSTQGLMGIAGEMTRSATAARMSGGNVVVMSVSGSGTQGLTASLPIVSVADTIDRDKDRLVESVALSFLITIYASSYIGYLSPLCGCAAKSGVGAAAGITYYLGGNTNEIRDAARNMVAGIAGVICDGGKPSCSMKSAAAAAIAVQSALLALRGEKVVSRQGLVSDTLKKTMQNLQRISVAMSEADETLLRILQE